MIAACGPWPHTPPLHWPIFVGICGESGVIDAAREAGIGVPEDIAVVGCTDNEAARLIQPPLTTVSVPAREIGVAAMPT